MLLVAMPFVPRLEASHRSRTVTVDIRSCLKAAGEMVLNCVDNFGLTVGGVLAELTVMLERGTSNKKLLGWRPSLVAWRPSLLVAIR